MALECAAQICVSPYIPGWRQRLRQWLPAYTEPLASGTPLSSPQSLPVGSPQSQQFRTADFPCHGLPSTASFQLATLVHFLKLLGAFTDLCQTQLPPTTGASNHSHNNNNKTSLNILAKPPKSPEPTSDQPPPVTSLSPLLQSYTLLTVRASESE